MTTPPISAYTPDVPLDLVDVPPALRLANKTPSPGLVAMLARHGPEAVPPAELAYDPTTGRYLLLDGAETWLAAQRARRHCLSAVVYHAPTKTWRDGRIQQTLARTPRHALDVAEQLSVVWGASRRRISKAELGRRFGMERSRVSHYLRLLTLSPRVKSALREGRLTVGQARPLVTFPHAVQDKVLDRVLKGNWTARQIETATRALKGKGPAPTAAAAKSADALRLERLISERVGMPVDLGAETLVFNFAGNLEVLEGLLERLGLADLF